MRAWKRLLVALFVLLASCNLVKPTSAPPSRATATPPLGVLPPKYFAVSPDKAIDIPGIGGPATLSVPQGAFSQGAELRLERSVAPGLPQNTPAVRLVSDVYEVELKGPADLRKPVTLSIPYKAELIPQGGNPRALTVVWWDGTAWREVPSKVDTQARVVSAQIARFSENRFSAAWSWFEDTAYDATGAIRDVFFTGKYVHGVFTIHYSKTGDHSPPPDDANRNGVPDYVEKLGQYLVQSRDIFEGRGPQETQRHFQGLNIPVSGTIHVFVKDTGYDAKKGEGGPLGDVYNLTTHIRIDNSLNDSQLSTTAAHELFHYWQWSVLPILTGNKHTWWLEATSAWAMDIAFPSTNLYIGSITNNKPNPPFEGFLGLPGRSQSEWYAAGSLAKYLEYHYPGFIVATFNRERGLRLTESWHTTFSKILREAPYNVTFTDAFTDYVASYFFHWDFDPDIPLWFRTASPLGLAKTSFLLGQGQYQRVQEILPPLSGRVVVLNARTESVGGQQVELKRAKLVVKQHGGEKRARVMVFATRGSGDDRRRIPLPGEMERTGVWLEVAPDMKLAVEGFGRSIEGRRLSEVDLVAANTSIVSDHTLDLEIYVLQPPEGLNVQNIGTDRVKISWTASSLPRGEKDDDKGALKGYALYRQVPGGQPALLERVDAKSPPSLELSVQKATGGQQQASLFMRTVDKYDTESSDSEPVLVRSAGPPQPPTKKLTGRIYLGATPSGQLDKMNHGLYVITPDDRRWRLISPRAIDGVAISPDGSKLAVGMLAETGAGPGDPQLAIFDAKDPAYKLLRSVFTTRPGTSSRAEQLTGPSWAGDSTTLALERVGDIHLYQYAQDKSQDKVTFWAMWEGYSPAWSPTDDRLVLQGKSGDGLYLLDNARLGAYKFDPKYEIWAKEASQGFRDLRQGAVKKIEGSPSGARAPRWSRDGKNIVFASKGVVSVIPAAGGSVKALTPADWKAGVPVYSPDGAYIAFARLEAEPNGGVWAMKADGTEPRQVLKTDLSHVWNIDLAWGP